MQNLIKILLPRQLLLLLILSTGLLNHVILIPNLLTAAGRDSWLSVIVASPISLFFLWLVYFIVKNSPNEGFFTLIRQRLGRTISTLLSIPVILFLFTSSYVTFRDLISNGSLKEKAENLKAQFRKSQDLRLIEHHTKMEM